MTRRVLPVLLFLLATSASANMASPVQPGTPVGEPAADLAGLRVAREALTLDLRPLAQTRLATITAEYRIVNSGAARVVPLQFVALGDEVQAAQVWLDAQPVPALALESLAVPDLWRTVTETPALDGDTVPYEADETLSMNGGLSFILTIPPGQHTIRVTYSVRPGSYDEGSHPNLVWQLAYSLAPARRWAGFGQLDIRVLLPTGWDAAASLPLRRDGDVLVGRFPGVPGDVLALSLRAPSPPLRVPFQIGAVLAALAVIVFVGLVAGRLAARSGRRARSALPASVLAGALAAAAVVAIWGTASDLGDSTAHGYGAVMTLIFFAGPVVVVVGTVLAQVVAVWAVRRWRSEADAVR